jgi:hypothetical protein
MLLKFSNSFHAGRRFVAALPDIEVVHTYGSPKGGGRIS